MTDLDSTKNLNKAIRDVVKGAGVIYTGLFLEYIIAFVVQILAARFLTTSEFGSVIAGTALIDIGAIVGTLGLGVGLTRNLPRYQSDAERLELAHAAFRIGLPLSILVGGAITLNANFIANRVFGDSSLAVSFRIFGAAVPFATILKLGVGGIRGQQCSRYRVYLKNFLQPVSRFALIIGAVTYGLGEIGVLAAYSIPYVLAGVISLYLLRRVLPGFSVVGHTSVSTASSLLRFSLPLSITNAFHFINRSADIFIILHLLDSGAVGVYGVVYGLSKLINMFSTAFNYLGMPISSELDSFGNGSEMLELNESILRWLVVASVPVLFPMLAYPADLIQFIYRPEYADGAVAFTILASGFAIHNVLSANTNILTAIGATKTLMLNKSVVASINIGLNLALVPRMGITGAAIATVASYVILDIAVVGEIYYYTDYFPLSREVVAPIIMAVPILAAGAGVASLFPVSIFYVALVSTVVSIAYLSSILIIFGLSREEIMIVRSIEDKYGLDFGPLDWFVRRF